MDTRPIPTTRQILVVDDTPANLVAIEAALAPLDRRVVSASSGTQALALLLEQEFALILLDVQMPGIDGFETARLIRERPQTQHVPLIFLTAHHHDESALLRAYELGAVDFLLKPFIPEVLRAKASFFVTLQERTEQLAAERVEREFENRRRDYETAALRRERDREAAAKRELARLNEALAASDRRKDAFIAILAHELRNPLAPLRTCIDLLRGDGQLTDHMLEILDRQTGSLSRLVDDLLDLSRIKADKLELRPELQDLTDIIEDAIGTSRPHIDGRGHALVFDAPAEGLPVVADSVRLTQVLANLLNNAARYTPRGGRIEVSCGAADDDVFVRVTDNGRGIPPELQPTIFDMFVQERVTSDGSGGLGLGLALCHRLVSLHHGSIAVASEGRDRGTTFEVRIPRAGSPRAPTPRVRTREMTPLPRAATVATIVVIDDNDDARDLLATLLRGRGHEVREARDGPTGVQLIRELKPDVAFIDLALPGMDGIQVVEALREDPTLATRMIALTGYSAPADRDRTRAAGYFEHLAKPASAAAIFDALTRALAGE